MAMFTSWADDDEHVNHWAEVVRGEVRGEVQLWPPQPSAGMDLLWSCSYGDVYIVGVIQEQGTILSFVNGITTIMNYAKKPCGFHSRAGFLPKLSNFILSIY